MLALEEKECLLTYLKDAMKGEQMLSDLYLAIRLALSTGTSKEEIWSLKRHQINWQESTITFDETKIDFCITVL